MGAKVFRINGFDRKKKLLIEKIESKGGFVMYKEPVAISIADFDGRLNGDLIEKTVHINGAATCFGTSLRLSPVEDLELGLCMADLFDGDDFIKLADAIED